MDQKYEGTFTEEVFEPDTEGSGVTIDDFYAHMPSHTYIYAPTRETWPAASVNKRLPWIKLPNKKTPLKPTDWLDRNRAVEQITWWPGEPMLIRDRLIMEGGWFERKDVTCFNQYRPPRIEHGNATRALPWVNHGFKLFGGLAHHAIQWMAHCVQNPGVKPNHALVLLGSPGIGKDTWLEPLKRAVGPWNFKEISPTHLLGEFNSFAQSVILRINESHDLCEINRFSLYERLKIYAASPPDVLRVNEKHMKEHYVLNCAGLIITSNYRTNGIYLPVDDRRHYVLASTLTMNSFEPSHKEYFNAMYAFYNDGGYEDVTAYLHGLDISRFDPKAPPPKTDAFWTIVNTHRPPEAAGIADAIDALGKPKALTISQLIAKASFKTAEWLTHRGNQNQIPHRLEDCGYALVSNPGSKRGYWKLGDVSVAVYAQAELDVSDQIAAVRELLEGLRKAKAAATPKSSTPTQA
jgi:hypothetical protein